MFDVGARSGAAEIPDGVIAAADAFATGMPQFDDLTVTVLWVI